jgi:glycosyltransferase involved in cell wall biosynthesis
MAALTDPNLPAALSAIPGPRLGYSGLISSRLNLTMLKTLAQEHPEWSLIFLGQENVLHESATWQSMLALPNVYYLGSVGVEQVPHYLKGFDVGLLPYQQNAESENLSPLKLYDYLAAGLPVAAVDIPAAREFEQVIHLADRPERFVEAIRAALADTKQIDQRGRQRIAEQHTWEQRAETLSTIIETFLRSRAETPGQPTFG